MRTLATVAVRSALVLCILTPVCLQAEPAFFRNDILVGAGPYAVVPGDFNGDGQRDLAVGTEDGLYVLLNAGDSKFGPPIRTEAAPLTFWLGAAADFNDDGLDDLVGSGFLYLSRGDGTFQSPRYLGAQEAVATADFNGDKKIDLLISNWDEGTRVLLGNGDGTFHPGAVVTTNRMVKVLIADFNGDGRTDVATVALDVTPPTETSLFVFLGRGDGTFGPGIETPVTGVLAAVDFNGDGLPDIVADRALSIMLGNGDGTFQSPIPYTSDVNRYPVAAGDFTGDGHADLIVVGQSGSYLYPGKGDGTSLPPVEQFLPLSSTVTTTDLDGDGRLDLVTANGYSNVSYNNVSVLLSRAEQRPEFQRALSAATGVAVVAPESLATLYIPTPVTAEETASPPWPTRLGGITLEVRDSAGATHLAPLLFVSPTQINFQVPAGVALGEATLSLQGTSGTAVAGSMDVGAVAPALFLAGNEMPLMTGVMVEADGSQVPVTKVECDSDWGCWPSPIALSTAGERPIYVTFYGTGFRGANTENVTCEARDFNGFGVVQLPVVYAGPQETPGVDQINIRVLPDVLAFSAYGEWGAYLTIRINGVPANRAYIWGQ